MEEWVGQWWHRAVIRAADASHPAAAVTLDAVRPSVALLFRAGGGDASVRIAPGGESRHGGPRGWIERLAGSGQRAVRPMLDPDTLALPPEIAVFPTAALNRDLYLWLAALASVFEPSGDWVADNRAATARALQRFPGLRARHRRLVDAHLAQRPSPGGMRGAQALFEAAVQAALRGDDHAPLFVTPAQVRPVWLWIDAGGRETQSQGRRASDGAAQGDRSEARPASDIRRRARRAQTPDARNPLLLVSKVESLTTWTEKLRMNAAVDDEPDPDAIAAADDMDTLSVTEGDQTTASRVRFDLDLPSASADDTPLGPGRRTPEWDWRKRALLADHCALQTMVARPAEPFRPPQALRATARRVRRRLEVLRAAPRWHRGEATGDELDLDAWVRFSTEACSGAPRSDAPSVWSRRVRGERSLATLLLADLSLSTDAYATDSARVIDVIRDALYVFGEALSATGDPFEVLGFSSVRRQHVRIQHLKGFDEPWGEQARARIGAIKPGYYTRMGAAIRDATRRLALRPERQRLLLVLTDGKPNDIDVYEGRYGLEDTRHAVRQAREAGLTPFCVTIDRKAHDYLPMLFGANGYALVHRPQDLVGRLAQAWSVLAR